MPKEPPPDSVSIPLTSVRSGSSQSPTLRPPDREGAASLAGSSVDLVHLSKEVSRQSSPGGFSDLPHPDTYRPQERAEGSSGDRGRDYSSDFEHLDADEDEHNMPSDLRHSMDDDKHHHQPLLSNDKSRHSYDREAGRPALSSRRSSRFRASSDAEENAHQATKKRYTYAAAFLLVSLVSFAVQTETAVYIQHNLHWDKAYCML